jgi:hypothetical protein
MSRTLSASKVISELGNSAIVETRCSVICDEVLVRRAQIRDAEIGTNLCLSRVASIFTAQEYLSCSWAEINYAKFLNKLLILEFATLSLNMGNITQC